jgi:LPXTG-motif cell wall-anchored protein
MLASPASAAPVAATLSDGCSMVNVVYTGADAAAAYTVKRDGVTVLSGTAQSGGPWNFSVFALAGQVIEVTGSITGSHTHVKPEGCTEPQVSVSIEDRCQGTSAITFHNTGTGPANGVFAIFKAGVTTLLPEIPAGDFTYLLEPVGEYQSYALKWAASVTGAAAIVIEHVYSTPGDCGGSHLEVSYSDKCTTLEWKVKNTGFGAQKVELLKGDTVVATEWAPVGDSAALSTEASAGNVFKLRYFGDDFIIGDPHTYQVPSGCTSLPTTGARTQLYLWVGAGLLLIGAVAFFFARRRKVILPPDAE